MTIFRVSKISIVATYVIFLMLAMAVWEGVRDSPDISTAAFLAMGFAAVTIASFVTILRLAKAKAGENRIKNKDPMHQQMIDAGYKAHVSIDSQGNEQITYIPPGGSEEDDD